MDAQPNQPNHLEAKGEVKKCQTSHHHHNHSFTLELHHHHHNPPNIADIKRFKYLAKSFKSSAKKLRPWMF
ncbi:hypothetical protein GBA52_013868 [Prunus armeniaca]|nr:hypothetical protein GBA52_013868 [Prunus armeniaca]